MSIESIAVSDELKELARILADWSATATSVTIYVYGSRVRGDHRPDSDVDVSIHIKDYSNEDMEWWTVINDDLFRTINAKLPGPIQILEPMDPLTRTVAGAPVVYEGPQREVRLASSET